MPALASEPLAGLFGLVMAGAQGNGLGASWTELKKELRGGMAKDPLDALAVTVLGGSFLFYLAEKDHNPKVNSYFDALVYISTCLSVGYSDIFARTEPGKAIATAIMTVGPAMAAKALEPPADEAAPPTGGDAEASLAVQQAIVEKLDAILVELRKGAQPAD